MKKRLLSFVLCLCMLATMLPTMAFAAEDEDPTAVLDEIPVQEEPTSEPTNEPVNEPDEEPSDEPILSDAQQAFVGAVAALDKDALLALAADYAADRAESGDAETAFFAAYDAVEGTDASAAALYAALTEAEQSDDTVAASYAALQDIIDSVNAALKVEANEEKATFVDQEQAINGLTIKTSDGSFSEDSNGQIVLETNGTYEISGTWDKSAPVESNSSKFAVTAGSGIEATVILNGITIDASSIGYVGPLNLGSAGACTVELRGSNILKAGNQTPGIMVNNAGVTIKQTAGQIGSLTVTGGGQWPGIGKSGDGGKITIESGTINATGGEHGAGIGGSNTYGGGTITIEGGIITATAGSGAQAIGNGANKDSSHPDAIVSQKNCIVQIGSIAVVYGQVALADPALTIQNLSIPVGTSLTLESGTVLTLTGTITNNGSITVAKDATMKNTGVFYNAGTFSGGGTVTNNGAMYYDRDHQIGISVQGSIEEIGETSYIAVDGKEENVIAVPLSADLAGSNSWYVVNSNVSSNGATVTGNVNLILVDGCTMTVNGAITLEDGASLTIYGQKAGTGALTISGSGINGSSGAVTINGGAVSATNSGMYGTTFDCKTITINGGTVTSTATGPCTTAMGGSSTNTTINGGEVTVSQTNQGRPFNGNLTVTGGTLDITSTGITGSSNAAIVEKTFTITGGVVTLPGNLNSSKICTTLKVTNGVLVGSKWTSAGVTNAVVNGTVKGNATLTKDYTIPAGTTWSIPSGASLTIQEGVTLTNNGTFYNAGTFSGEGVVANNGTMYYYEGHSIAVQVNGTSPIKTDGFSYIDADGQIEYAIATPLPTDTTWSAGWYVVNSNVSSSGATVSGDVHLILADGCTMSVTGTITLGNNASLTIYGQQSGTGTLKINGQGINGSSGAVKINSGTISVTNTTNNNVFTCKTITINGGKVNVTNSAKSKATFACSTITINGGTVTSTVTGASTSAMGTSSTNTTINGGKVTVSQSNAGNCFNGSVTVNGGIVEVKNVGTNAVDKNLTIQSGVWIGSHSTGGTYSANNAVVDNEAIGSAMLDEDYAIPAGTTWTIPSGASLTIQEGVTLTNAGIIYNDGTFSGGGTVRNNGTIYYLTDHPITVKVEGNAPVEKGSTSYIDENGQTKYAVASPVYTGTTWDHDWYVVNDDVTVSGRINVSGHVNLILADGYSLKANNGIEVADGNSLTIYSQSKGTGALTATGYNADSGIGGGGNITINGGVVNATAKSNYWYDGYPAGIGGNGTNSVNANCGVIVINGGTVTANAVYKGIGGGGDNTSGSITINGGTVTATGIGVNGEKSTVDTYIYGGVVILTSRTINAAKNSDWKGLVVGGDTIGVYGDSFTLTQDVEIPNNGPTTIGDGKTLIIDEGATLTIGEYTTLNIKNGATLSINGGATLNIKSGATLNINSGATLTNKGTITIENEGTLKVKGTAENKDNGKLNSSGTVEKKTITAPESVTLSSRTENSITLNTISKNDLTTKYKCGNGGWQTSPTFSNLSAGTGYNFYACFENDYYKSTASEAALIYTIPATPTVSINYTEETLSTTTDMEYSTDSGANWAPCTENMKATVFGWIGTQETAVQFRVKENGSVPASDVATVTIPARPAAPSALQNSSISKTSSTITISGTSTNNQYGYQTGSEEIEWKAGGTTTTQLTGLEKDTTYYLCVRTKATASTFASAPSSALEVKTLDTFTVTLTDNDMGITGFQYSTDGSNYTDYSDAITRDAGSSLYIKAILATGYTFEKWTDGVTSNPYQIKSIADNVSYTPSSTLNTYTVTHALTNIIATGEGTATHGTAYTTTLTADIGYNLPSAITVKVGDQTLTSGYTYSDAVVTIDASKVTGAVEITAVGVAKTYNITLDGNGTNSISGTATATYDGTLSSITAATRSGYTLNGYYTAASGGTKVADANGTLVASVSDYTNASGKWIRDEATTLYAQWTVIGAVAPELSGNNPADVTFGSISGSMTVTVTNANTNDYSYTYAWYKGAAATGTATSNATAASYEIPTTLDAGTRYFTVQVTATRKDNKQTATADHTFAVTVTRAAVSINPTTDANKLTRTYADATFDVTDMFSIDTNAGEQTYTLSNGGTGDGMLTEAGVLTVTKAGEFKIHVATAVNGNYAAGSANVTLTVNKGKSAGTVSMSGYTYNGTVSTPIINDKVGDGAVTYYYNTSDSTTDGTEWSDITATTLNKGDYWMYAVIAETDLYESYTTPTVQFTVSPAQVTALDLTALVIAPVRNATPDTTEIKETQYTGTVGWNDNPTVFASGTVYTATVTLTPTANYTFDGVAANSFTYTGATSVTNDADSGTVKIEFPRTSSPSASNTTTTTVSNADGSTTTTVTNKTTGTVTETTKYPDGSTVTVETKKDGTSTTTEKQANGVTTVTKTDKDGVAVDVTVTVPSSVKDEVKVEIPTNLGKTDGTVSAEITYTNGTKETVTGNYSDGKVTIPVSGSATIEILDDFVPLASARPFADVPTDAYYYDAVRWAVENGVTAGTSATTFAPNATCTRAQTVTFLWRAMGSPEPESTSNPFTDVDKDAYYYKAVLWAVEKGITSGTNATTFAPDETITRSQTVTFLWRAAGTPVVDYAMSFSDVEQDAYYTEAVRWAVSEGITSGTGESAFSPANDCTRAQIVTFLYRRLAK